MIEPTLTPVDKIPGASESLTKVQEIPGQEAGLTKVDAVPGAPTLTPVDVFAEDAPIDLFDQWKKSQPEVSTFDTVREVGGHFLKGAGQAAKLIFDRTLGTTRALIDPGQNIDDKFDNLVTQNVATGAEVGAEAFKGFATTGSYIKSLAPRAVNKVFDTLSEDPNERKEARDLALIAERRFHREARDLAKSSNDGRVITDAIVNSITGGQTNPLTDTAVNEAGAQFLSNFVDPDGAQLLVKGAVRGLTGRALAEVAVKQLPYTGELAELERAALQTRAKALETQTEILAAKSAGADVAELEVQLSKDVSAIEEAQQIFNKKQEYYANQAVALGLEKDLGKGVLQKSTGAVIQGGGKVAQGAGEVVGAVNSKIDELLAHFSAGSPGGEDVVDAVGKNIPGRSWLGAAEGILKQGGRDVSEAGRLIGATESSLPYFKSLARALPDGSIGRWSASQMERFEFLADGGRWAFDTIEAGGRGAAIGAGFGALSGDPLAGATQGAFFGMGGSQFGQFVKMNSLGEVFLRQQTDINLSRKRAEGRGPKQLAAFDKLGEGEKLMVASLEAAHPNLFIDATNKDGVSWYDYNGAVGQIAIDPKNPLAGALTHEVKHHLGRNPEVAQAVETKLLGDPDAGIPGMFTAVDEAGKPIVNEIPDAQNPENVRREFQLSPEFYAVREEYLQRLRDKNLPTADYERSNKLIAHEIWAEAQTGNLLGRQPNGEFDVVALQRMGPVQRKVSDMIGDSEVVANSAFLQKSLAKVGVVFDGLSGRAANTGLFSKTVDVPGMKSVLKKYYELTDRERAIEGDPESYGTKFYTEDEILKSPALTELFSSGYDTVRDPISGKVRFVGEKEAKQRAQEFFTELTKELDGYAGNEPGTVKKQDVVDANGRKSQVWMGTRIPEAIIAKMEASGRFNEAQLNMLRTTSKLLTEARGNEINFFYQPATKRGGKVYRTRPITERTETPMSIRITKDGNIVINTISQEKLTRNLVNAIKGGKAELWGNDFQKAWADVQTYLGNHAEGRPGDFGLGVQKKDFINSLFGQFTKEQREFNPFLQDISERQARNNGIVQSRRLDRTNKMFVLSTTFKPDYAKVARNFSPQGTPLKGSLGKGEIKFKHYSDDGSIKELDPKNFGKSGITPRSEMSGLNRSYAYAEGGKLGQDKGLVDRRGKIYTGSIAKGKIYDGVKDVLDYNGMINREKADQMLVDAGFTGIYREGSGGRKQLEFFEKVKVQRETSGKQFSPGPLTQDNIPNKKDTEAFIKDFALTTDEAAAYRTVVDNVRDSDPSALPIEPQYDENGRPKFEVEDGVTTLKVRQLKYDLVLAPEVLQLKARSKDPKKDFSWREKGTDILSERLVEQANAARNEPTTQAGIGWYSKMRGWLQNRLGAGIEVFSQVLGATSARTPVDENFKQTLDGVKRFSRGDYDELLQRYDEHIAPIKARLEAGEIDADQARKEINTFAEVPTRSNGKKFNANSQKVLQALYGNWLELTQGPKTPNFAGNLSGRTLKATIDVWAARTARRLMFENKTFNEATGRISNAPNRWRILPEAETGVEFTRKIGLDLGGDFGFAQEAFQKAADKLGMEADDLQALLWFHEKHIWDQNGWTKAAGKVKSSFEGEAGKLDTERFQLGVTTFTSADDFSQATFNKELADTRTKVAENPAIVYARVSPSRGLYGSTIEPSFDAEFVVTRGADVSPVLGHIVELGKKTNQNDVFMSKVVTADHANARPGVEIGFKASEDTAFVDQVVAALRSDVVDGFTVAVDRRGRPIGIRAQFIPEISARWADDKGQFLDPDQVQTSAKKWAQKARETLANLHPDIKSRLSYGQETFFDTRVIGREEYSQAHSWADSSLGNELGRRSQALGLPVRERGGQSAGSDGGGSGTAGGVVPRPKRSVTPVRDAAGKVIRYDVE